MSHELLRHHIEEGPTLGEIVNAHPGVLEVLEEFGIRIDPWTLIALRSSLTELAEYSALRDPRELQDAVEAYLSGNEQ